MEDFAHTVISNLQTDDSQTSRLLFLSRASNSEERNFVLGLQGPPGTGKSETIVALVKLLLKINPDMKILIAAPSNAAVDSVGRRITGLRESFWVKKKVKKPKQPQTLSEALGMSIVKSADEEVEIDVLVSWLHSSIRQQCMNVWFSWSSKTICLLSTL